MRLRMRRGIIGRGGEGTRVSLGRIGPARVDLLVSQKINFVPTYLGSLKEVRSGSLGPVAKLLLFQQRRQ